MKPVNYLLLLSLSLLLLACQPATTPRGPQGGDFVLQTAHGPLDSKTLRGKVLLLFFGYTNCPDICPAAMASGAQALNALTPDERQRVRLIMVSVDPQRDTVAHLQTYTAYFHPEMLGATGTPEEIAALAKAYGAGYARQPARPDGAYAVDHTTSIYLVSTHGKLAEVLSMDASKDSIVAAIRKQL